MEQHVKVVAMLNIALGGLGVLLAIGVLLFFGGIAGLVIADGDSDADVAVPILGAIGTVAAFVLAILSVPALIAGIGLLQFRPWAQTLTIVVSIFHLLNFPIGTAAGIYGLWVLFNDETKALIKARAA